MSQSREKKTSGPPLFLLTPPNVNKVSREHLHLDMTANLTASVKHNGKDIQLPFPLMLEGDDLSRMVRVSNRVDPSVSVEIPYFAERVYDNILRAEAESSKSPPGLLHEMQPDMPELMTFVPCDAIIRTGVAWFQQHFADAHFVLLD